MSKPTTSQEICSQYGIEPAVFMAMPAWERSLFRGAYACDVLHVEEDPRGSNRGDDVDRYNQAAGADLGSPWCGSFGTTMLLDSGVGKDQLPANPASVHSWLDWADKKGLILARPVRGCAGLIIEGPTTGHFVRVSTVASGLVNTLEGNTNPGGSREGYGCYRRSRPVTEFHCFIDLARLHS